jgi:hypothetical protein
MLPPSLFKPAVILNHSSSSKFKIVNINGLLILLISFDRQTSITYLHFFWQVWFHLGFHLKFFDKKVLYLEIYEDLFCKRDCVSSDGKKLFHKNRSISSGCFEEMFFVMLLTNITLNFCFVQSLYLHSMRSIWLMETIVLAHIFENVLVWIIFNTIDNNPFIDEILFEH